MVVFDHEHEKESSTSTLERIHSTWQTISLRRDFYQNWRTSIREPIAPHRRIFYAIMAFDLTATEKIETAAETTYTEVFSILIVGSRGNTLKFFLVKTRRFNLFHLRIMQPKRLNSD